jgi:uncharacterized protein with NAD-binding domain and iron-sulfur cluster
LSRPVHRGQFDITIYQMGWRIGGKGASGRGPSGRIEEHGLHLWLGFYDNAFRLLRECYAELAGDPRGFAVADWREAFTPESDVGLLLEAGPATWLSWSACFPPQPGLPGDKLDPAQQFRLSNYLIRAIALLRTLVFGVEIQQRGDTHRQFDISEISSAGVSFAEAEAEGLAETIRALLTGGVFATAFVLAEGLVLLQAAIGLVGPSLEGLLTDFAERLAAGIRDWLEANLLADHRYRHIFEIIDLVLAIVIGTFRFGLLTDPRGLDAINEYECREWLLLNGASARAVNSPFVRGLYDLALAYEAGDPQRPGLAAGQALRGSLRMFFGYRGALFWRMRAGMGDVVFAPFYEALRRRGVKFRFFHKLTNVRLAPEGERRDGRSHITALDFDIQAQVKGGGEYAPLIAVNGRQCWPAAPLWEQLEEGDRLAGTGCDFEAQCDGRRAATRRLRLGSDFDFVVLAVGIGVIPHVCREILARDRRWRLMVEQVKTVATQSFQLWLDRDLGELGWRGPPFVVSAFVKPFDTWCDMAQVIPEEGWVSPPKTSIYFCNVLADPPEGPPEDVSAEYCAARQNEVRENAIAFIERHLRPLWPRAFTAEGEFRWELLADATAQATPPVHGGRRRERFGTQYWRANVSPSDRHTLALPGSLRYRISPLDMSYDNLTIAGDWTDCGFNEGCVEAAVMSGRLAAHALSGRPALADIVGYDHP